MELTVDIWILNHEIKCQCSQWIAIFQVWHGFLWKKMKMIFKENLQINFNDFFWANCVIFPVKRANFYVEKAKVCIKKEILFIKKTISCAKRRYFSINFTMNGFIIISWLYIIWICRISKRIHHKASNGAYGSYEHYMIYHQKNILFFNCQFYSPYSKQLHSPRSR